MKLFQKNPQVKKPKPAMLTLQKHLSPKEIETKLDYIKINSQYNRIVSANGYPRTIREGWLNKIICSQTDFDASIFIHPSSIDNVLTTLNYELVKQRSDILSMEQKGLVNPSLQIQYDDTLSTLKNLQKGEEKLFYFSLYMNLKSETKEKLELVTKKILGELNSIMIQTLVPKMLMGKAIQTIIPLNNNTLNTKKEITSSALSACFPFTTSFLEEKPTGIIFGINKSNNIPVILDVFKLPNQNGIVLASSGAGKSYAVKSLILKNTFNGIKTIIIDPQAEYSSLAKECSGQVVKISENSESMINPLDLMGHSFSEKMFSLMSLYAIMFPEINPIQKAILDKATIECYKEFKIIPESPETWNNEMPTLADLLKEISKIKTSSKGLDKRDVELIESRLKMFVTGSFSFLNKKTKIKISEKGIVSFDIKELPSNIKPVVMFLILDWLLKKMQKSQEKTSVIFDEGWSLLRTAEQSDYLFQMIKTARKFGTGITVITQEVQDLINSNAGRAILANTSWKLLLRQEPSVIKELIQTFNLNQEETNILLTSMPGQGLLIAGNNRIPLKIIVSKEEHKIITTNPEEVWNHSNSKEEELEELLKQRIHKKSALSAEQQEFLKKQNYTEHAYTNLSGWEENLFAKIPPNCSNTVQKFLLINELNSAISTITPIIKTNYSSIPNIVFELGEESFAITILDQVNQKNKLEISLANAQCMKEYKHVIISGQKEELDKLSDEFYKIETTKLKEFLEELGGILNE